MKVVIDTNVFISGVFWKGPPQQVLRAWEKGLFRLVVSQDILSEYQRVLADLSVHKPGIDFERALGLIDLHAEVVEPVLSARGICDDPDDDKFLGTAISAGAEYVVSGDKALLATDGFRGVKVVTPRTFIERMK